MNAATQEYMATVARVHAVAGRNPTNSRRKQCPKCKIYYLLPMYVKIQAMGETRWIKIGGVCPSPRCDHSEVDFNNSEIPKDE